MLAGSVGGEAYQSCRHCTANIVCRSCVKARCNFENLVAFPLGNRSSFSDRVRCVSLQVAIWHPTFYSSIDEDGKQMSSEVACQPMEQLQAVEREKRRLQLLGIGLADEIKAFDFFQHHKSTNRKDYQLKSPCDAAFFWDPGNHLPRSAGSESSSGLAKPPPLDQQLLELARAVITAVPGTKQHQLSRAFHPASALTTVLVELLPVEDVIMEEGLEAPETVSRGSEGRKRSQRQQPKSTACVHFRYAAETVYRLLPIISRAPDNLVQRLQQCRLELSEAVKAHENSSWNCGDVVFCMPSWQNQHLFRGVIGVLEDAPDSNTSQLSVSVSSWRNKSAGFENQLQDACKAICAANQVITGLAHPFLLKRQQKTIISDKSWNGIS